MAPSDTKRRQLMGKIAYAVKRHVLKPAGIMNRYENWMNNVEKHYWTANTKHKQLPLISVVVPTYNTPDKYLYPLIQSFLNQTYENWQLCIADGSTDHQRSAVIREHAKKDRRIVYKKLTSNTGIAGNTNEGIKIAKGEFIGFVDHDDTLSPQAFNEIVSVINSHPSVDILYSDEDKLSDDGKYRTLPFFKPDWSPDLLLGVNYITHFLVVRSTLLKKVGPLKQEYNGAQDYDLILRLTEKTKNIIHIPKILYHWRLADGSTAKNVGEKNYADSAGQKALSAAIKRRNIKASVIEVKERPTNYRLKYDLPKKLPKVSIIIPFKDKADLLEQCVSSIVNKSTYDNYEIILVSNNSTEESTHVLLRSLIKNPNINVLYWDKPFNYSKINNYGVKASCGEYIILLNNDTEVITNEWIEELIGVASQPNVGAVGPLLLYPDKKDGIQHAGVILGMGSMAGHVFRHRQPEEWTDFGLSVWPRNYLAVTAACLAVSKKVYMKAGGLDETFTVAGNDVAFCLRLHEQGYNNIFWPFARLFHHESVSVGTYNNGIQLDYDHSLKYYKKYHESGDQYFNKNLDLMNEQVGVKEKL